MGPGAATVTGVPGEDGRVTWPPGGRPAATSATAWWIAVAVCCLVAANLVAHRILPAAAPGVAIALVLAMLAVARASGLTAAELGVARGTWMRGLRWAAVPAAVVVLACGVVLLVAALRDRVTPVEGSWAGVVRQVVLVVPLLTVLPEELAFRGVIWALLRRAAGARVATLVSSALFGLWHVQVALGGGPANDTAAGALGDGPAWVAARVFGTVLVTFLAGLLFCALRAGSGSLLAPIGLHWTVNSAGIVLVHLV